MLNCRLYAYVNEFDADVLITDGDILLGNISKVIFVALLNFLFVRKLLAVFYSIFQIFL